MQASLGDSLNERPNCRVRVCGSEKFANLYPKLAEIRKIKQNLEN